MKDTAVCRNKEIGKEVEAPVVRHSSRPRLQEPAWWTAPGASGCCYERVDPASSGGGGCQHRVCLFLVS